ncbi:hypothetical protein DF186_16115, partial [Enterococcus hirae]
DRPDQTGVEHAVGGGAPARGRWCRPGVGRTHERGAHRQQQRGERRQQRGRADDGTDGLSVQCDHEGCPLW